MSSLAGLLAIISGLAFVVIFVKFATGEFLADNRGWLIASDACTLVLTGSCILVAVVTS